MAQPSTSLTLAQAKEKRDTIITSVEKYAESITKLAPPGTNAAYYLEELRLYLSQPDKDGNPSKLLECEPISILRGVLRVAQTGLSLGVSCDLLPFGKTCQYNSRYNGLIELAIRAGTRVINYDVVYDDDVVFEFQKGTPTRLKHVSGPRRGKVTHFYTVAEVASQSYAFEVMTFEEVERHKAKYSKQWKNTPLMDCLWYGTKTTSRKLSKVLPKSRQFNAALQFDREVEEEDIPEGEFSVIEPDSPKFNGTKPAAAAAPEPTPAPASEAKAAPVQDEETAVDRAKATLLIGSPGSWGGQAGKPLGPMSTKHLEQIRKWCATKLEEKGDNEDLQLMVDAITLILLDRSIDPAQMELNPESKAPAMAGAVAVPAGMPEEDDGLPF